MLTARGSPRGYGIGLALYTLIVVALWPSFRHSTSLNSLTARSHLRCLIIKFSPRMGCETS